MTNQHLETKFSRVMLVDDNSIELHIASHMATKYHFSKTLLPYLEAEKALKYLQENQENVSSLPEVIFLDIYMPIMSGFQFMEEYDKLSNTLKKHCKVFIISSSNDEEDIKKATTDKNVVAFKEKPITKDFFDTISTTFVNATNRNVAD